MNKTLTPTAKTIALLLHREHRITSSYTAHGIYLWGGFESDFVRVTKSGYIHEYETKLSKADFARDFKKGRGRRKKHRQLREGESPLATFSFIVPEALVLKDEVPDWAGLYYVTDAWDIKQVKKPRRLPHTIKLQPNFGKILRRWESWRLYNILMGQLDKKLNRKYKEMENGRI